MQLKKYQSIILIVASLLFGQAISQLQAQVRLGIKNGANVSRIFTGAPLNQTANIGYTGGMIVEVGFPDAIAIRGELLYSQKGFTQRFFNTATTSNFTLAMNYIELPILFQLRRGEDQKYYVLNAGPSIGYWVNGTVIDRSFGDRFKTPYEFGVNDSRLEGTFNLGGGIVFDSNIGELYVEARYGLGFTNIVKNLANNQRRQNRTLGVTASLMFGQRLLNAESATPNDL